MYEEFFGLTEKPFSIQPDPTFLYWGRTHRLAYAMLEYGVLNHAGISVVTGEVGCGKTTLVHRLLDQLSDSHTVALISNIQQGRGDLLSWVLMGFGQPFSGKSHVELFSELQNFFIAEYAKGRRVVLIIDEAQNLSMDMLEELRLLSNINAGKDQLLQLILVGQPELKDQLSRPELLQLAQRVGSDFHLSPLSAEEVADYLSTRLAIAGCREHVFTDEAVDLIAHQSGGVPRVINILADTALVYAFSAGELHVDADIVRSVMHDKSEYGVFGLPSGGGASLAPAPQKKSELDKFADEKRGLRARAAPLLKSVRRKGASDDAQETDAAPEPKSSRPAAFAARDEVAAGADESTQVDPEPAGRADPMPEPVVDPVITVPDQSSKDDAPTPNQNDIAAFSPQADENEADAPARNEQSEKPAVAAALAASDETVAELERPQAAMEPETATAPVVPDVIAESDREKVHSTAAVSEASAITGVVVVGQNKAVSPAAAIRSAGDGRAIVFVAVGAAPDAIAEARDAGAIVVEGLERTLTTGGRARNAGYRQLKKIAPHVRFVQFMDAECELAPEWIANAEKFLERRPEVSVVEGRYVGDTDDFLPQPMSDDEEGGVSEQEVQCADGGSVLIRVEAFEAAGGFRGDLITAETEDLCIRLRRRNGCVWRLEDAMAVTPSAERTLSALWSQSYRRGYQNAYCASIYGGPPERLGLSETTQSAFWGFGFPALIAVLAVAAAIIGGNMAPAIPAVVSAGSVIALGVAGYVAKVIAGAVARGPLKSGSWAAALGSVASAFAEFLGILRFMVGRKRVRRTA